MLGRKNAKQQCIVDLTVHFSTTIGQTLKLTYSLIPRRQYNACSWRHKNAVAALQTVQYTSAGLRPTCISTLSGLARVGYCVKRKSDKL